MKKKVSGFPEREFRTAFSNDFRAPYTMDALRDRQVAEWGARWGYQKGLAEAEGLARAKGGEAFKEALEKYNREGASIEFRDWLRAQEGEIEK